MTKDSDMSLKMFAQPLRGGNAEGCGEGSEAAAVTAMLMTNWWALHLGIFACLYVCIVHTEYSATDRKQGVK